MNFSRAAARQIRNLESKNIRNAVHVVLAHLCREMDETFNVGENDKLGGKDDDVAVFEMQVNKDRDS